MTDARDRGHGDRDGRDAPVTGGRAIDGVIEIELVGDPRLTRPSGPDRSPPDAPNRRRAVTIALVGGAVLGIVVGAVLIGRDDSDDETAGATTLPGDVLSALITTPPTLGPFEPIPPVPAATDAPIPSTARADTSLGASRVVAPSYPELDSIALADVVAIDLADAVDRLAADVPRRSTTHVELGIKGYLLDVELLRDPTNDRWQLTFRSGDAVRVVVVDAALDSTYVNPGTTDMVVIPTEQFLLGSGAASADEFFGDLLRGPVRSDTFRAPGTIGRSMVEVGGIGPAREFVTSVAGELAPEWQLYVFSPVSEFRAEDRPATLEYHAYVDETGRLVAVDGVARIGNVPQLVLHRIEDLETVIEIDLPDTATRSMEPLSTETVTDPSSPGATTGTAPVTAP